MGVICTIISGVFSDFTRLDLLGIGEEKQTNRLQVKRDHIRLKAKDGAARHVAQDDLSSFEKLVFEYPLFLEGR